MAHKRSSGNGWQESKLTVKARISYLLQNDFMSDFTFVSDGVKFPVHKFILASTSSVFYPMLFGAMAEQQELDLGSYGNADCISEFLKFIYTDQVSLNWQNVFQILNLAKCYLIPSLAEICSKYMEESISEHNVLNVLQQCLLFEETTVIQQCFAIISENAAEILKEQSFLSINLPSITAILKLDTLNIKEIDLFLAVDKWCSSQLIKEGKVVCGESKREVLGDAVYMVRFPTMSLKEFGKHCPLSGLLTPEETHNLIYVLSEDSKNLQKNFIDRIAFSTKPRNKPSTRSRVSVHSKPKSKARFLSKEVLANRIPSNPKYQNWNYGHRNRKDAIGFTVNELAVLKGISLFGDPKSNRISELTITTNDGILEPTFTSGKPNSGPVSESFQVSFEQPIEIIPKQRNYISVQISGQASKGFFACAKEVYETDGFVCRFFDPSDFALLETSLASGQFPELVFEV
eukprot:Seg385.9 transcript_id=Seg385.9/GoldUCD/mRNA.D3Y31 product="BTB/POZ domain-containing protein 3" protein_id=Seg385.9/GoldUCD/D3Y31